MANTSSAKKAMRSSARRALRNRSAKSAVKTRIAHFRRATTTEGEQVTELATAAISSLDRGAAKGILHANNAARRKSRLQKRLNAALAGTITTEPAKGTRKSTAEKTPKAAKPAKAAKQPAKAAPAAKKPAAKRSPKTSS